MLVLVTIFIIIRLIWPTSNNSTWENWFNTIAHIFIFYSIAERTYKQYKNSKIKNCFIKVDGEGVSWRLPKVDARVKENEIVVWSDIKKIIIEEQNITVKYMSTYFSDNIPFETIIEEDKSLLIEALNDQIQHRSIPCENRMAA